MPKWARRTKSLDALLPVLYLRGISAGDFQEALAALLGKDAPNLSAAVIARLKSEWEDEYRRWQKRDLSARHYVYVWADGVYLQARMEPQAECMLVLMGATAEGKKELIGFQTGMRESGQSWKELLVDLKARGLVVAPQAAIGDGALGFWKALDEAFPTTRHQRCWLHKTLNVLDKLPKSMQPSAHKDLREIWLSPSRGAAEAAMTIFAEKYAPKYDKAVECLIKDRQTLLMFFDLPADHWDHLRTSDEIDKSFLVRDLLFWRSTGDRVAKVGHEDVSPAAQPSPSLLIGGTRAPFTRTTRLPSADELFVGMFSVARDIDLPIAQFLDIVRIGRATLVALFRRLSSL